MSRTDRGAVRVLHVDDEPQVAETAAAFLENDRAAFEVTTATSASEGLDHLEAQPVDCIVSDYEMPGMDGLEFLGAVRERDADLSFILFTGKGSEEIASEAISAGVTDYLQKGTGTDQYTLLANRIERAVSAARTEAALAETEREYSTLVRNLPGMVYRRGADPEASLEFVSEHVSELTGYDPVELEAGEVRWGGDVVHRDDREGVLERIRAAIDAVEPFELTYRIRTAAGATKWVWEKGRGVFEDGDLTAIEGFVTDVTDRREAELRRRKYETIVETMDDAAFILDAEGRFEFVNDTFLAVTQTDREAVVGHSWEVIADMTAGDVHAQWADILEQFTAGAVERERIEFETALAGVERTVDLRLTRVEEDGEYRGVVGVARDVTERKEREREFERYRTLVETVGDPMYVLDRTGTIKVANRAMADRLGYEKEELIGMHATDVMPVEDVQRGKELLFEIAGEADRSAATFEMQAIPKEGEPFLCEDQIAILTDEEGGFAGSVGVVRDITDRKARERELERYETIVEAVGDPVYSLDEDARFTFINDAIEQVTGYAPEELQGEHVSMVMPEADVETGTAIIETLLESDDRRNATFEMDLLTREGEHVPSENHMALLPVAEDGSIRGTAGVVRDITERKRREQRLEQFASVVSEDLRNPLSVIDGRVDLLAETGDLAHLEEIESAVDRMDRLIEELRTLAWEDQSQGEADRVGLEEAARAAWQSVDANGATLSVAEDLGTVTADGARLRQVFENLFRNAVEHGSTTPGSPAQQDTVEHGSAAETSPAAVADRDADAIGQGEDGTVSVRVGPIDRGNGTADGVYVADDGPGIPSGDREQVFEDGFTSIEAGTGLGLSIAANVAEAHDWSIAVTESQEGGARVELTGFD